MSFFGSQSGIKEILKVSNLILSKMSCNLKGLLILGCLRKPQKNLINFPYFLSFLCIIWVNLRAKYFVQLTRKLRISSNHFEMRHAVWSI